MDDLMSETSAIKWRQLRKLLPDKSGPWLVTNNLKAKDAHGRKSHVWLIYNVYRDGKMFVAFSDTSMKIQNLSHYASVPGLTKE